MKKNYLFIAIGILFLGLLSFLVFSNFGESQKPKLLENAVLTLESDNNIFQKNEEFLVTMTLDSQDSEVAAADFVLKFDPKYLRVTDLTSGSYFSTYPINNKNRDYVKLSGVATYDGDALILPKGKDTVGLITFQALEAGKTEITFDSKKTIVATDGQNILDKNKLSKLEVIIE